MWLALNVISTRPVLNAPAAGPIFNAPAAGPIFKPSRRFLLIITIQVQNKNTLRCTRMFAMWIVLALLRKELKWPTELQHIQYALKWFQSKENTESNFGSKWINNSIKLEKVRPLRGLNGGHELMEKDIAMFMGEFRGHKEVSRTWRRRSQGCMLPRGRSRFLSGGEFESTACLTHDAVDNYSIALHDQTCTR